MNAILNLKLHQYNQKFDTAHICLINVIKKRNKSFHHTSSTVSRRNNREKVHRNIFIARESLEGTFARSAMLHKFGISAAYSFRLSQRVWLSQTAPRGDQNNKIRELLVSAFALTPAQVALSRDKPCATLQNGAGEKEENAGLTSSRRAIRRRSLIRGTNKCLNCRAPSDCHSGETDWRDGTVTFR